MKTKKHIVRIGMDTIRASTLSEWIRIWLVVNIFPQMGEFVRKDFISQAKETVQSFYDRPQDLRALAEHLGQSETFDYYSENGFPKAGQDA